MKEKKAFWKSKTFWGMVVTAIVLFYQALEQAVGLPPIPDEVLKLLGAAGLLLVGYGRAVADKPLGLSDYGRTRTR